MKVQEVDYEFCRKTLAENDADLYFVSLMAPINIREDLWVLFAFWSEIARIRLLVSESHMGLIRLQWWRDEITAVCHGRYTPKGGVMDALAVFIQKYDLSESLFFPILNARRFEIQGDMPDSVEGVMAFLGDLYGALLKIILNISGEGDFDDLIPVLALNIGIVDVLGRAREKSFVFENRSDFIDAFVRIKSIDHKVLCAINGVFDVLFHHMQACNFDISVPRFHRRPYLFEIRALIRSWT